jgi:hypothetical protein
LVGAGVHRDISLLIGWQATKSLSSRFTALVSSLGFWQIARSQYA